MIQIPKKSASNNVRLFDQLAAWTPELRHLIEGAPIQPQPMPQRLDDLQSLVDFESSIACKPLDHLRFYATVAYHSLTDAFLMTQRHAALRRILTSPNPRASDLIATHSNSGRWISVGISHLTTSRQHLARPAVLANRIPGGWSICGTVPWVTAASLSDALVIAACDAQEFSKQYLFYLPMRTEHVECGPSLDLLALSDSCTAEVRLVDAPLTPNELLHGPCENVLSASQSSGAGGLQTTALALGLAARIIDRIGEKSSVISEISAVAESFQSQWHELDEKMSRASIPGQKDVDSGILRKDANDLVLRASQAAMAIEKGAGYLASSLASQWVREAMFFLVWSCPQTIATQHLCDLSRFDSTVNLGS